MSAFLDRSADSPGWESRTVEVVLAEAAERASSASHPATL